MIAFLVALTFLSTPQLVHSAGIFLSLFTDKHCSAPSTTNSNVTLGINVCAVTAGLESFIYTPVACTTGFSKAWVFSDVACAVLSLLFSRMAVRWFERTPLNSAYI